ncbi:MAG: pyridoxal phosphate-dependent aminotransferase [Rhodothermales bacterium]
MKDLSRRTLNLVQSDIRAITGMVNAVNGINLGQGICDMPAPDVVKHAAQIAIDEDRSIYTGYSGIPPLRTAILEKARIFNSLPAESVEDVMVSVGSTGAFVSAIFGLLDPGDEAVLFEPFYGYHRNLIGLTGASIRFVPSHGSNWEVDFQALRDGITPRTKLVVLCTPGNPSGKVWTRSELATLLEIMQEHDLYAITDEIYEYMTYDGREHVSLASLPGAYERTVTISGFSKTYNMTGWRLGYAVGPQAILEKMGLLNDLFFICAPAPLQHGVAAAFRMGQEYFDRMLNDYTAKRRMMCETLEQCGFGVSWPQGAYYVMADVRPPASVRSGFEDDRAACETLIREAGVATVPGNSFFEKPESGSAYLRFCYAKEHAVLADACDRLLEAYSFARL